MACWSSYQLGGADQGLGSTLYTTFRVLYSPLYQAAMQAYLLCTIEEKSWAQINKNTLFLV